MHSNDRLGDVTKDKATNQGQRRITHGWTCVSCNFAEQTKIGKKRVPSELQYSIPGATSLAAAPYRIPPLTAAAVDIISWAACVSSNLQDSAAHRSPTCPDCGLC